MAAATASVLRPNPASTRASALQSSVVGSSVSDSEYVELSLTAGFYAMVSRMLDAMRVELDDDVRDYQPRLP